MKVSEEDIKAEKTMLNKHLRINELLHEYSRLFYHILLPCAIVIKIILIITLINLFQRRANDLPDSAAAEARKDQSRTFHVGHRCHDKVAQE